jgi:signal transduction histidine kinase
MRAAAAYAVIVLENRRLVDRLHASVDDLWASRARIAAVADDARRRIERDLHDGAQQRLVALRLRLARESERLQAGSPQAAAVLDELGLETEETIDEVRALAHGIYPSLLAERGLPDALRAAALAAPISTSLATDGVGRYSPEVESTVYFACLEALQNAAKHAHAEHVAITLVAGERLRFEIADDGEGFENGALTNGAGLTNLRDRVSAIGGELQIESSRGGGTRVSGSLPVANGRA